VRYSYKLRHKGRWCYICIMTTIVMTQRWEQLLPELYSKMMTYYSPPYPYRQELKNFCRECWKGECECEYCEECGCDDCECKVCVNCDKVYQYDDDIGAEGVGYNCCWFDAFGECFYGTEGSPDCQCDDCICCDFG
jgi:hypothetical protein